MKVQSGQRKSFTSAAGTKLLSIRRVVRLRAGLRGNVCLALNLFAGLVQGAVLHVPSEYASIGTALDFSQHGDTILVAPGTYWERIIAPAGSRMIAGTFLLEGDSALIAGTILSPASNAPPDSLAILEVWNPSARLQLVGFSLRHGRGVGSQVSLEHFGGAVYQKRGALTVRHCIFADDSALIGSAIFSDSGSTLRIDDCRFTRNTSVQSTIEFRGDSLFVHRTRFYRNLTTKAAAAFAIRNRFVLFSECLVDSNVLGYMVFPALSIGWCNQVQIDRCAFIANSVDTLVSFGGVATNFFASNVLISNSQFISNTGETGCALEMAETTADVRDCVFRMNRASFSAAAISCAQNTSLRLERCVIEDNSAPRWPALTSVVDVQIEDCRIFRNRCDWLDSAAAIGVFDNARVRIANSWLEGNFPYAFWAMGTRRIADIDSCYWGHSTGPYHATLNPDGSGDAIGGSNVNFIPWYPDTSFLVVPEPPRPLPERFALTAYPNPFNAAIRLRLDVAAAGIYEIIVFDLLGRRIAKIWQGPAVGFAEAVFDGRALPAGIYFAQAREIPRNRPIATAKLVLLK